MAWGLSTRKPGTGREIAILTFLLACIGHGDTARWPIIVLRKILESRPPGCHGLAGRTGVGPAYGKASMRVWVWSSENSGAQAAADGFEAALSRDERARRARPADDRTATFFRFNDRLLFTI